jgi:CHC2 zinc finger/Toprim domain
MEYSLERAIELARAIQVEDEVMRRGYQLKRKGGQLEGPCPVCGGVDRFVITPKRNVWFCRQCDTGGDAIKLVKHVEGISFIDAVSMLTGAQDLVSEEQAQKRIRQAAEAQALKDEANRRYAEEQYKVAMRIWDDAVCIWDTPAQKYLESRCCDGMFPYDRDQVLRYHPHCPLGPGTTHPSLIALIRNIETDEPQGIQHTALTPEGQKIERRTMGAMKGGAIKLWPQSTVKDHLVVGEGLETVLSAALHIKQDYSLTPAWSLMSDSNLGKLPIIPGVNTLVALIDNDENDAGQKAFDALVTGWKGRTLEWLKHPVVGKDVNDWVMKQQGKMTGQTEAAA